MPGATTRRLRPAGLPAPRALPLLAGLLAALSLPPGARAQTPDPTAAADTAAADTAATVDTAAVPVEIGPGAAVAARLPAGHTPRRALVRAALVPGWGQLYNRQYYKIPLVYAGLGGLVAVSLTLHDEYRRYQRAYLYKAWVDVGEPERFAAFKPVYDALVEQASGREIPARTLQGLRDSYRRNRDLSFFGIGLFYGFTLLDAYVAAHLLDFDVGEDLTLGARPRPGGAAVVARLRF